MKYKNKNVLINIESDEVFNALVNKRSSFTVDF